MNLENQPFSHFLTGTARFEIQVTEHEHENENTSVALFFFFGKRDSELSGSLELRTRLTCEVRGTCVNEYKVVKLQYTKSREKSANVMISKLENPLILIRIKVFSLKFRNERKARKSCFLANSKNNL